jgi:hypothetical protein
LRKPRATQRKNAAGTHCQKGKARTLIWSREGETVQLNFGAIIQLIEARKNSYLE